MQRLEGRWMGIDFGLARVGVALSDPMGILASGFETISWDGHDVDAVRGQLADIAVQQKVRGIVLGFPNRTDGGESSLSNLVHELASFLEQTVGVPVLLRDERYTTVIARRKLKERGLSEKQMRSVLDQTAAQILLQEYLDHLRKTDY
ncbi:MAG: Holliday junction resolvase RuvX [Clostridia bacterium]|nr:Holliday junction resolvase RuvX [Clostridia bacterium]